MKKVVVIGGGGHAKVIIELLRSKPELELVGYTDCNPKGQLLGLNALGDDSVLPELFSNGVHHAFVAIGDNKLRHKLYRSVQEIGFNLVNAISPHAVISNSAQLGNGVAVMPGAVIGTEAKVGNNVIVNTLASVDHECLVEDSCHIAPGSHVAGNVRIGEGTFVGIGSKVIDGVSIGRWSILGGGTVIIGQVPDKCLVVGVPGKVRKSLA